MNTLIEAIEMIEAPLEDAIDEAFGFNDGALEQLAIAQRAVHLAWGLAGVRLPRGPGQPRAQFRPRRADGTLK